MSFSQPRHPERRAMPLTSLIDLMFILIIFFVTTTSFREDEQQMDIQLASTLTGKFVEPQKTEIIINVAQDGAITIGRRAFNLDELNTLLRGLARDYPNEHVIIRGDKNAIYDRVLRVLDAARAAGIRNARLATVRETTEPGN